MEVYVAQKEIEWIKEAAKKAGRPNISIIGPGGAATAPATITACFYNGELRKNDSKNVPLLNELKVTYDSLQIATAFSDLIPTRAFYSPLIGGYCGGPEGAAIVGVAGVVLSYLCFGSSFTTMDPHHIHYPGSTYRSGIWVASITGQAVSRNSNFLLSNNLFTAAGPCTDMILAEISAATIATACSGVSMGPSVGAANTKYQDYCSGLETRFMAEVAHATTKAGIKREDANELALDLIKQYETKIIEAPIGKKFQDCYHLKTIKPTKDWITKYKHAKKQLIELGIPLDNTTKPQW
jgi:methylamine--corrinoid protein Co-methyltransferase